MNEISILPGLRFSRKFLGCLLEHPDTFYKSKVKSKVKFGLVQLDAHDNVRERAILEPLQSLKSVQQAISIGLQVIPLPNCLFGGVKGKNNVVHAFEHLESRHFFTVDLKDFFPRITNNQVHYTLTALGFSWHEARIITRLTTLNGSLPQGAPSSPIIANLVITPLAREMNEFCRKHGIIFTSFFDDLVFSSQNDFSFKTRELLEIIRNGGFLPNKNKIHYKTAMCEITGLFVGSKRLKFEKQMLERANNPHVAQYIQFATKLYQDRFGSQRVSIG